MSKNKYKKEDRYPCKLYFFFQLIVLEELLYPSLNQLHRCRKSLNTTIYSLLNHAYCLYIEQLTPADNVINLVTV